ncbi:MAG: hypothetical protein ACYSO3_02310 [Planctomycetota bacterium]
MRDHLTADLAEAAEAVADGDKAAGIDADNVTGVVPTVLQNFGGLFGKLQVPFHHIRSFDIQ